MNDDYWILKTRDTVRLFSGLAGTAAITSDGPIDKGSNKGQWTKPKEGRIKINVDARISTNNWIGLGMVARNDAGKVVGAGVKRIKGGIKPQIAEALSMSFGLQIALMRGWEYVEAESDCLHLIHSLQHCITERHDEGVVMEDIQWQKNHFKDCYWQHVKRAGNNLAHCIAGEDPGMDSDTRIWLDAFPQFIMSLAEEDNHSRS